MRALYRASDARKTMACMKRPAAKRSRTEQLGELESFRRNVPHVSASALSAITKEGKARGLPELDSRDDVRAARDAAVDAETEYGPLYQVNEDMPLKKRWQVTLVLHPPFSIVSRDAVYVYRVFQLCRRFAPR